MLVRAANAAATDGDGVDFAANYRAWKELLGGRVLPWTWLGPPASTDGLAAAEVVVEAAPGEPLYVVRIEQGLPDLEAEAFAQRLRQLVPGALLGFSSYPTRAQAASFGVPWDACVAMFDLGLPQVFFASQRAELERVVADHRDRPLQVVVSPGDDAGWLATARVGLERYLGASIWRHGLDQFAEWARALGPRPDAARSVPPAGAGPGTVSQPAVASPAAASPAPAPAGAGHAAASRPAAASPAPASRPAAVALRAGTGGEAVATAPAPVAAAVQNGDHGRNGKGAQAHGQGTGEPGGAVDLTAPRAGGSGVAADRSATADDEPAGDEFDMATIADLENALRKVLNEGTGQGQSSWAATSASSYQATRTVHERMGEATTVARATREAVDAAQLALNERIGQLADVAQATREAVDGLDLDLPEKQVQAIADAISAKLLDVPPATLTDDEVQAIADAIAAKLLDIPLGMVALDDASISRVGDEVADRVAGRLGPAVISALRHQFSRE
ncbi:MAG TPA: hypothetical protein VF486_00715 [Actinomycetes bacterium]